MDNENFFDNCYTDDYPDNTNGKELIEYAAKMLREINGETMEGE